MMAGLAPGSGPKAQSQTQARGLNESGADGVRFFYGQLRSAMARYGHFGDDATLVSLYHRFPAYYFGQC